MNGDIGRQEHAVKSLGSLCVLAAVVVLLVNCTTLQTRSNGPIASINNDDIGWSGTYSGLWADVRGAEANKVLEIGPAARPHLLEALDDPEKFVVAHVLLTLISGQQFSVSGEEWNHLRVELNHDGTVSIDPRQQHEIVTLWRNP